ncbi:MAG: hypothetical protein IPI58_08620 [Alphaproteobacteria bacterium]|nr:MAG: hypothetical protein IPI58_08620 [Alphaproteobacteria bacterium]
MKKLLLATAILTLTGLQQPAFSHGDEDHSKTEQHGQHEPSAVHDMATQITTKDDALKVMRDGVSFMDEAVSKHRADLFSDGKMMDQLHDVTVHIDEAAKFLESDAANIEPEKKTRLSSALKQLVKTTTDFHVATHDRNIDKTLVELKKSQGALKLVEAALK